MAEESDMFAPGWPGIPPRWTSSAKSGLGTAVSRGNLRNIGVHVLRHTFCSHLAMRGAGARAIQELAGHRDLSTTRRYMHVSPSAVESAIRVLDEPAG